MGGDGQTYLDKEKEKKVLPKTIKILIHVCVKDGGGGGAKDTLNFNIPLISYLSLYTHF